MSKCTAARCVVALTRRRDVHEVARRLGAATGTAGIAPVCVPLASKFAHTVVCEVELVVAVVVSR